MRKKVYIILACVLLFLQFLVQINLARTDTQTSDEAVHLFSGYQYLTTGNFRYNPEHPPLMKYIAAVPLLFIQPKVPQSAAEYEKKFENFYFFGDVDQFRVAADFLYHAGNDQNQLLFAGRLMMIFVTLLLGIAIFGIAAYFWGWAGGFVAVALYTLDPLINGHGHFITNDILLALMTLLTLFAFWLFLHNATWRMAIIFGVLLALAQLSKFSALALIPFTAAILIGYLIWKKVEWKVFWLHIAKFAVAMAVVNIVVVIGYGFHIVPAPPTSSIAKSLIGANYVTADQLFDAPMIDSAYSFLRYFLLPREYYLGLTSFIFHASAGHEAYLLGQTSQMGWWYYFPIVFAAKTPLITMAVVIFAIVFAFMNRKKRGLVAFILGAALLHLALGMMSHVNIGLRHIMPVYPLLFVLAGAVGANIYVFILIGALFLQSFFIYPHFISYFNIASGGTSNGYKIAVDSNTDWGQDGLRLKKYIDDHQLQNVYIEYWNSNAQKFNPTHGNNLVIGVTALFENPEYAWLRSKAPTAQITPSVFLYSF